MKSFYNTIKVFFSIILLSVVIPLQAEAQSKISGTVTDDTTLPVPGASVVVKGSKNGTITDDKGHYSIQASPGDVLVFSFIGTQSQEIKLGTQTTLNVQLKGDAKSLNDVVVVGYGTQKKANLTGAVDQGRQ